MITVYRLWLHGLYRLYGPCCPLSPERPLNLITHSLPWRLYCDCDLLFFSYLMISDGTPWWLCWDLLLFSYLVINDRTPTVIVLWLSGVPDLFDRNTILSGGDLSHYQVPHCIRVFFYLVWFVFIHHNFQFYFELCTYCNILDIYLSWNLNFVNYLLFYVKLLIFFKKF